MNKNDFIPAEVILKNEEGEEFRFEEGILFSGSYGKNIGEFILELAKKTGV